MSGSQAERLASDALDSGWLQVTLEGRVLAGAGGGLALFGAADGESFSRAARAGLVHLPAGLRELLPLRPSRGVLALRHPCLLDTVALPVFITVIGHGEIFDLLITSSQVKDAAPSGDGQTRDTFDSSQHGVCVTDGECVLYVNQVFAEMLGYAASEMPGMPASALIDSADKEAFCRVQDTVLAGIDGSDGVSGSLLTSDGHHREVSGHASRVRYEGRIVVLWTVFDVTRQKRSESALRNYAQRMRLLSRQIIEVQEDERRTLARELHDEIGQQLTLVKLSLEAVRDDAKGHTLDDALAAVERLTQQVRELSLDLRPSMLDDLGLVAALRWYAQRAANLAGFALDFAFDPDFPRLKAATETLYFRVAQEAITNAVRHAAARRLDVRLRLIGDLIVLNVIDDGCGFDPVAAREAALRGSSGGLLGMHERAALAGADLQLVSGAKQGCGVTLTLPVVSAGVRKFSA